MEVEIGRGKKARRSYGLDELAIVPNRRTRDADSVDIGWKLGAHLLELPLVAAPYDSVVSPATGVALGKLGGLAVLDLEGLWTRYEDGDAQLERIAGLAPEDAARGLVEIYSEPVKAELIGRRVEELRVGGAMAAGAFTPGRVAAHAPAAIEAGLDVLVIRGTVMSAEHLGAPRAALDLKRFIGDLRIPVAVGGVASFASALHLMRTGAAAVLVGVGAVRHSLTRDTIGVGVGQATAIAEVAAARADHLLETGRYVALIADGGVLGGGDVARAIACGADAVMLGEPLAAAHEAPGRGFHWTRSAVHPAVPRGLRRRVEQKASLSEIVLGPAFDNDGRMNLMGALRAAMALTGHETIHELQKADLVTAPAPWRQ